MPSGEKPEESGDKGGWRSEADKWVTLEPEIILVSLRFAAADR